MKINKTILLLLWLVVATVAFLRPRNDDNTDGAVVSPTTPTDTIIVEPPASDTWPVFIEALIHVESRGDSTAVGTKNDVGVLQITPIMVEDANRIVGEERYTLDDRTDRDKSIEIFNIIQNHYNPDHDMHYALKIWNSRAPISYHRAVMDKYREIYGAE